ncbi:MAG: hypothetical protein NVS4B8_05540 [Herpetosiphon sp.]
MAVAAQIGKGKLEIGNDPVLAQLHQAANAVTQHRRVVQGNSAATDTQMVTALAVGLRGGAHDPVQSKSRIQRLTCAVGAAAEETGASIQLQGNGVFVLVMGLDRTLSLGQSSGLAVAVARQIEQEMDDLRFGLSCSMGSSWSSAVGEIIIADAIDDAARLLHMAQSWSEYTLLCPEPLALLLNQSSEVARTPLELTNPHSPALRVYSLDLVPAERAIALGG